VINPRIGFSDAVFYNPDAFQDADVLLFHAKGNVLSWMIRAFSHSFWNHSGLLYWKPAEGERRGEWMVVEAKWHVAETPLWRYFTKDFALGVYRWPSPLTTEEQENIITMEKPRFARDQVGVPYNWPLVLRIRLEQMIHGADNIGTLDPLTKTDCVRPICSRLVNVAFLAAKKIMGLGTFASPRDLTKHLSRFCLYNCTEMEVAK